MKPRLLDLFCCEGGASMGYHRAGFDVFGVDRFRHKDAKGKWAGPTQARYPFPSFQGDALAFLSERGHEFDAIHASPPCQAYSITKHSHGNEHPEFVDVTRDLLQASGKPWVMENVPGAPMPGALVLCGSEFGLQALDTDGRRVTLRRHRLFESNVNLWGAGGCSCKVDRAAGRIAGVYGGGSSDNNHAKNVRRGGYTPAKDVAADLMGIDWMTQYGLAQALPPVYTQFIGEQLLAEVTARAAA